ncbi:MAG: hypothetical protein WCA63_10325, partial [Gallionella sp.]
HGLSMRATEVAGKLTHMFNRMATHPKSNSRCTQYDEGNCHFSFQLIPIPDRNTACGSLQPLALSLSKGACGSTGSPRTGYIVGVSIWNRNNKPTAQ